MMKVVPSGQPVSRTRRFSPPSMFSFMPVSCPRARVVISTWETDAMEGSASPRKPSVRMSSSCSALCSFEVAWFSKASRTWPGSMPQPLSVTRR